jgi:hypothetical protein
MPPFDAQAARALARRTRGVGEILADVKQAVVRAAEQGGFEAVVPLPDAQHVPAGASTNNASFLVTHLLERGLPAWAEAVQHATRAGYDVRPSWTPLPEGAGCDGLLLSWSLVIDEPPAPPLLMSAHLAYRMAMSARAQHHWVEKAQDAVRNAAMRGVTSCTVRDHEPVESAAWTRRRELLAQAGFTTELVKSQTGADLIIRW